LLWFILSVPSLRSAVPGYSDRLLVTFSDKDLEMGQALDQLARETTAQIDQKQAQIKGQLEELKDNRLQRHFQAGSGKMVAPSTQPPLQGQPQDRSGTLSAGGVAADQYAAQYGRERFSGRVSSSARQPQGQSGVAGPGLQVEAEEVRGRGVVVDQAYAPQSASTGTQLYTARGTYSLPVTLPRSASAGQAPGEVRLDFARPSGQAQLTLWAVPLNTIRKLYGTAAILAALFAVLALVKAWPRLRGLTGQGGFGKMA
jgi:hypothetical protein